MDIDVVHDRVEIGILAEGAVELFRDYALYRDQKDAERTPNCQLNTGSFLPQYEVLENAADLQAGDFYWTHSEVDVRKDLNDVLVNFSEARRKALIFVLQLFTRYEVVVGQDYWTGRFRRMFPRIEFQNWGIVAGFTESQVHTKFYRKLNQLMNLESDEFYESYVNDPILAGRMQHIAALVTDKEDLVSLGAFSMLEGAILFSAFAFFKSHRQPGINMIPNAVAGINFSAREEELHSDVGAYCYRVLRDERRLRPSRLREIEAKLKRVASLLFEHECAIIDRIASFGEIRGWDSQEHKNFVKSRLATVLEHLEIDNSDWVVAKEDNPVAEWFYDSIKAYSYQDFFYVQGREYVRTWPLEGFIWRNPNVESTTGVSS